MALERGFTLNQRQILCLSPLSSPRRGNTYSFLILTRTSLEQQTCPGVSLSPCPALSLRLSAFPGSFTSCSPCENSHAPLCSCSTAGAPAPPVTSCPPPVTSLLTGAWGESGRCYINIRHFLPCPLSCGAQLCVLRHLQNHAPALQMFVPSGQQSRQSLRMETGIELGHKVQWNYGSDKGWWGWGIILSSSLSSGGQ